MRKLDSRVISQALFLDTPLLAGGALEPGISEGERRSSVCLPWGGYPSALYRRIHSTRGATPHRHSGGNAVEIRNPEASA